MTVPAAMASTNRRTTRAVATTRPSEPAIFGVTWRLYDDEPTESNAAGTAEIKRAGVRHGVKMIVVRTKEAGDAMCVDLVGRA